ncbi:MAG: hypothetical protein JXA01_05580 [Dehalococcoidia bacterium]|nr:hypothetical protein [Dehalococcoidia bacterium]
MMRSGALHILCLVLLMIAVAACTSPDMLTSSTLPAPKTPPELPSTPVIQLHTDIYEGPTGTVNDGTFSFKWGSTLSSVDPSTLTYATFLQGYDRDYTPFLPDTSRTFTNLPAGSYIFYVKAQNTSGQIEQQPASRNFAVASAPPQQFARIPAPSSPGGITLIGVDINSIVSGNNGLTLYALSSLSGRLYRSDSGGTGWLDISGKIAGGLPWVDLAVAPDDPQFVAVATDSGRDIYVSADGGATDFSSTGLASAIGAGQAARCIAISPSYSSPKREIAAGTWNGAAGGGVFINILTSFGGGWFNANPGGIDVSAIAYSPGGDTLLLVASTGTGTFLYAGVRDLGSQTVTWNTLSGYPVELCIPGKGTPGTAPNYAAISLPGDYDSSRPYSRQVFVSWSRNHASQGIYRVADSIPYSMNAPEPVASIAFYGTTASGKLLAGAVKCISSAGCYQVQTYLCTNPVNNYPVWLVSQKPPTGSRAAMVAWSPDGKTGFAGTSGTESAVSHSINNGNTWNQ